MSRYSAAVFATLTVLLTAQLGVALGQTSSPIEVIEIIGTTPLGAELDADSIAANVQTATAEEIRERGALDLADFMRRSLGSVFVNEAQSNPLQPDVQYRGFVGSPLLGLPQGLAVYQDGVRSNEPFGDTVNWALIPESAIDSVYLLPGANPLFGLNALGGAIAIRTKDGFTSPDTRAEVLAGSFGRTALQAETGGTFGGGLGYFLTASHFEEDGWRDFSPSEAEQIFAKLSSEGERSRIDTSLTLVDTDLIGNGAAPEHLLELEPEAIFTRPDRTQNDLAMLNVTAEQRVSDAITLRGNLYVRRSDISTLNGDDSDFEECEDTPDFICEEEDGAEEIALDENGDAIAFDDELEGATINRSSTEQDGAGFGLQADIESRLAGRDNLFTAGVAYDAGDIAFGASTELGALDATRLAVPGGVFVGEAFTGLEATVENTGLFVSNNFSLGATGTLTVSGRYNRTHVVLEDQLDDDLDGDHTFQRFNPAVGFTMGNDALKFYVGYSEANRAPSPVELTCADEDDPCRLPNAFLADPPLEQVVAKTFEAGVRGAFAEGRWHAGLFHTTNDDDILFISAGALTNQGFFDNVGETRRLGLELNVSGEAGDKVAWSVDYTQLEATFREGFSVPSPNNPEASDGEIAVEPGDHLPLIPERLLKAGLRFSPSARWTFGLDVINAAGAYFRGDEGNLAEKLEDYTLLNARMEYRLGEHASLFLSVDNLLDEEYATFGLFGEADEVLGANFGEPSFLSPGAPRAAWAGVRVQF
ncbi:MAG TPA: TonB-dependent receptor [Gammaproteobacteria bacterium]|nr:TonB-dependent receptor [Gammaproteobacteria bacterium]